MITGAQNYTIADIFQPEANIKYLVPKYQREYIWTRNEWANLFDDLCENSPGIFLGSIICIKHDIDALKTQVLEVIDGQQRLVTLSLFYAALFEWFNTQGDLDEDLRNEQYNLRHRLIVKANKSYLKLEPSYQQQNYQDYRAVLKQIKIIDHTEIPKYLGNRRIYRAYRYFFERLNEKDHKEKLVFKVKDIQGILEKINAASLVKIEVNSHSDAFILFESLNNRGVPLSAMDIIKNKLLSALEKKKKGSIDVNFDKWNQLLEYLTEDSNVQQRFLRQYYNTFKISGKINIKSIPKATRSALIRIYETLIDKDAMWLFEDLHAKAEIYNRLISSDNATNSKAINDKMLELDRIGGVTSYSLLMYLLSLNSISPSEIIDTTELLVRYFVRRNLTDYPATRNLDAIFMDLIENLNKKKDPIPIKTHIRSFLLQPNVCAGDEIFKQKLAGNIYEENTQVTRFILCRIEESQRTKETMTDLWERDEKERYVWTVEHIFPQGQHIPQSWIQMIAGGDEKKAREAQEEWVHKLGNLTLSGYNSKLGNLSFTEKRDRKDLRGKHVGYKNGLFLNEPLKKKEDWTVTDISERTTSLVDLAMRLFKL